MNPTKIMVCTSDDAEWTQDAIHQACILGRNTGAEIVMVKMLQTQHISWLGVPDLMGYRQSEIEGYSHTAEDYGVSFCLTSYQYYALSDAVTELAEEINADVVFAMLPKSMLKVWHHYQMQNLEAKLKRQGRLLNAFEMPAEVEMGAVLSPA